MKAIKKLTKKIAPEFIKGVYHKICGIHAATAHKYPAREMVVIGVTGTKGKTSTANYIWSVLTAGGYRAGLVSSANFRFEEREEANAYKMTMPSPYIIQKKLREMADSGIKVVVVEMTSEGMKQFRHTGIPVDIAVFTNLTPEHLGSHNNDFDVYKRAKSPLFKALTSGRKVLHGRDIPKVIIANADSEHATYYLSFPADQKITFGINDGEVQAIGVATENGGTTFTTLGTRFSLSIPGVFNVYNALPAIVVGNILGIPNVEINRGLTALSVIPGRMEKIDEGQDFSVYVDYAHEPASMNALLITAESMREKGKKIILLTGIIGGGRASRVPLVEDAARRADYLIITNEDPYEDDPEEMLETLRQAAIHEGKNDGKNLFAILDRTTAIKKALSLAKDGDIVLISGKGAEETMMVKGGPIPWNERKIVRQLVKEDAECRR